MNANRYSDSGYFFSSRPDNTVCRHITTLPGAIEHTLSREDRLDKLAKHYYGDPSLWYLILDANPEISYAGEIDMGVFTGKIIVIPEQPTDFL